MNGRERQPGFRQKEIRDADDKELSAILRYSAGVEPAGSL
jgi:hypothetical protein